MTTRKKIVLTKSYIHKSASPFFEADKALG